VLIWPSGQLSALPGIISTGTGIDRQQAWAHVQCEEGPGEKICFGDSVWFEPDKKYWHGSAPDVVVSHIAVAEALDDQGC